MKYLNKFQNEEDYYKFVYDGGSTTYSMTNSSLVNDTGNVYFSTFDEIVQNVPTGYAELEYIENNSSAVINTTIPINLQMHTLSLYYSETAYVNSFLIRSNKMRIYHGYYTSSNGNLQNFMGNYYYGSDDSTCLVGKTMYYPVLKANPQDTEKIYINTYIKAISSVIGTQIVNNYTWHITCKNLATNSYYLNDWIQELPRNIESYNYSDHTLRIFAANTSGSNPFSGRLYSLSFYPNIHSEGISSIISSYTYYYIPAKRLSDNKVGLMEVARYKNGFSMGIPPQYYYNFLTSTTSSEFIAGPIKKPRESSLLYYKENDIIHR